MSAVGGNGQNASRASASVGEAGSTVVASLLPSDHKPGFQRPLSSPTTGMPWTVRLRATLRLFSSMPTMTAGIGSVMADQPVEQDQVARGSSFQQEIGSALFQHPGGNGAVQNFFRGAGEDRDVA